MGIGGVKLDSQSGIKELETMKNLTLHVNCC
jgi:hypothetical protein